MAKKGALWSTQESINRKLYEKKEEEFIYFSEFIIH